MPKYTAPHYLKLKRGLSGLGIFAQETISKGSFVVEYLGKVISEHDPQNNKYLFRLNNKFCIDGSPRYNFARYINHSCKPNCEAIVKNNRILLYAIKKINPSEELTFDYGKDYFNEFIKPYGCRCQKCQR